MNLLRPRLLAGLAASLVFLGACGSDSTSDSVSDTQTTESVTADSTPAETTPAGPATTVAAAASEAADAFPITIKHAFGETVIPAQPTRVAAVAWANHEVPIALGVVPVGMAKATWGDDDNDGVLPWVEQKLADLGAETPALFDETDGINIEAVADTKPDVILASYSGLKQEDYDALSKIAPVIAYPEVPWGTSVQDMIRMNAAALGMSTQGEALIAALDEQTKTALAKHPQLAGKKLLFAYLDPTDLSKIGFYTSHDTRPGFIHNLGLPLPTVVSEESAKTKEFYVTVSSELADRFSDVDVIVTYGEADKAIVKQMQADPLLSKIPAVKSGSIAILQNSTPLAASANPSPLSIGWGIDQYFALLTAAVPAA
jgi:iron complex transport system substrate-binding protein